MERAHHPISLRGRATTWDEGMFHNFFQRKKLPAKRKEAEVPIGEGKTIAILTSGGDAPGMNAAVRAATGMALRNGATVFAVHNGYKGLVKGGDYIRQIDWKDVNGIILEGGTNIGSARCMEFKERPGRLQAAENLVNLGISNLIVIGGDGSLTGADLFKQEWASLLKELVQQGRIDASLETKYAYLNIVGMVGSIDNDMCGFSMTIGTDTALHRITTAIDALLTTAQSHERTFIIEVMGRNCGFLALRAGIACGADWVFIPEQPPDVEEWEAALVASLARRQAKGIKHSLVIVAEGATDRVRRPITCDYLKKILSEKLGADTRVTRLGHVQRGGAPSAYDRILATRCGAEAALAIMQATDSTPARVVGVRWNSIVQIDLQESVRLTRSVNEALNQKDYARAMALRGPSFRTELDIYLQARTLKPCAEHEVQFNIAVLCAGAPAGGSNAAIKAIARLVQYKGHNIFGVLEGFEGLANGDFKQLQYLDVLGWVRQGGTKIGTRRSTPLRIENGLEKISAQLTLHKIHGLVVIGGFEGFVGMLELYKSRDKYQALCIPMALVPATISNNVPGTEISLGADTAINTVMESIDTLKTSASSSRRRLFIVETMGGHCGYVATLGALAGGADNVYTYEDEVHIEDLQRDVTHCRRKFNKFPHAVLVRNEKCSINYTASFMQALFEEEGRYSTDDYPHFSVRNNVLGHLQQGGSPSPLDRTRGLKMGSSAVDFLMEHMEANLDANGKVFTDTPQSAAVIGIIGGGQPAPTNLEDAAEDADFDTRLPTATKKQWWQRLIPLVRILELNHSPGEMYKAEATVTDCFPVPKTLDSAPSPQRGSRMSAAEKSKRFSESKSKPPRAASEPTSASSSIPVSPEEEDDGPSSPHKSTAL